MITINGMFFSVYILTAMISGCAAWALGKSIIFAWKLRAYQHLRPMIHREGVKMRLAATLSCIALVIVGSVFWAVDRSHWNAAILMLNFILITLWSLSSVLFLSVAWGHRPKLLNRVLMSAGLAFFPLALAASRWLPSLHF